MLWLISQPWSLIWQVSCCHPAANNQNNQKKQVHGDKVWKLVTYAGTMSWFIEYGDMAAAAPAPWNKNEQIQQVHGKKYCNSNLYVDLWFDFFQLNLTQ